MTITPTRPTEEELTSLLTRAIAAGCESPWAANGCFIQAASGLLLAWIQGHELAFHPHDPGHISGEYGAPPELVELLNACPELDQDWRRQMAAEQLAALIAQGIERDPAKARNGLTAIASAIGTKASHHDHAGLVDADHLEELALIAVGQD